jgi:hypothetical protein
MASLAIDAVYDARSLIHRITVDAGAFMVMLELWQSKQSVSTRREK